MAEEKTNTTTGKVAEKTAAATLAEVRKSMKIDYFTDDNLLK